MSQDSKPRDGMVSGPRSMPPPDGPNLTRGNTSKTGSVYYYHWPRLIGVFPRPEFLHDYPVPEGGAPNINSFLGPRETHEGRLYVPRWGARAHTREGQLRVSEFPYSLFCAAGSVTVRSLISIYQR